MKMHLAGKTDQAKADLARLAIIKKQREEAARKKEEEKKGKHSSVTNRLLVHDSKGIHCHSFLFTFSKRGSSSGSKRNELTLLEMMYGYY